MEVNGFCQRYGGFARGDMDMDMANSQMPFGFCFGWWTLIGMGINTSTSWIIYTATYYTATATATATATERAKETSQYDSLDASRICNANGHFSRLASNRGAKCHGQPCAAAANSGFREASWKHNESLSSQFHSGAPVSYQPSFNCPSTVLPGEAKHLSAQPES